MPSLLHYIVLRLTETLRSRKFYHNKRFIIIKQKGVWGFFGVHSAQILCSNSRNRTSSRRERSTDHACSVITFTQRDWGNMFVHMEYPTPPRQNTLFPRNDWELYFPVIPREHISSVFVLFSLFCPLMHSHHTINYHHVMVIKVKSCRNIWRGTRVWWPRQQNFSVKLNHCELFTDAPVLTPFPPTSRRRAALNLSVFREERRVWWDHGWGVHGLTGASFYASGPWRLQKKKTWTDHESS